MLLRVAAIVGSAIWAVSLGFGWSAYADMLKMGGGSGLFASSVESARNALLIQSFMAALLMLWGIFYKRKK